MRSVSTSPMGGRRLLVLAGGALLLASCTVGPNYVKPTVSAPPAFKEVEGWKRGEPKDEALRGPWWELFADPQLTALESRVAVANESVAVAVAQLRQAQALVKSARAGYFPTAAAGASATRSQLSGATVPGPAVDLQPVTEHTLPVSVSWELDLWGRVRRTVEANRAGAAASAADLGATLLLAQAELAQDYFLLRASDAQKVLFDATVAAYERSLQLTKNRYEAGVAARADVLQAETQLKSAKAQAIDLGVQRAQLEHAIAVLVGKAPAELSLPPSPLTASPPAIPVGVPSELLERRPDVAAAERRMAAANAQIGVAQAAYYPNVTLSGSLGYEAAELAKWFAWPARFWSLGAGLSETFFDGGARSAQVEQARAAYDGTTASYRQTVLTAFQEVEDNLAALRILESEAQVQDEAVALAKQSTEVAMNQYKAGTVSYLNVVTAQATELANERTAAALLASRMTASVLLVKALGGGWNAGVLP